LRDWDFDENISDNSKIRNGDKIRVLPLNFSNLVKLDLKFENPVALQCLKLQKRLHTRKSNFTMKIDEELDESTLSSIKNEQFRMPILKKSLIIDDLFSFKNI
jgi:hypothetical protein